MSIERPVIVVGAPRSGTTLIYRILSFAPELWHLKAESHVVFEGPLKPSLDRFESNLVTEDQLSDDEITEFLRKRFYDLALNYDRSPFASSRVSEGVSFIDKFKFNLYAKFAAEFSRFRKPSTIRLLEKTPKNCFRIALLNSLFPDAVFIYVTRNPEDNIASLYKGWLSSYSFFGVPVRRFSRYGYRLPKGFEIKGYSGEFWNFALVPGWESLNSCDLLEVCARQYTLCNEFALKELSKLESNRVLMVQHEDVVTDPLASFKRMFEFSGVAFPDALYAVVNELPKINVSSAPFNSNFDLERLKSFSFLHSISAELGYHV